MKMSSQKKLNYTIVQEHYWSNEIAYHLIQIRSIHEIFKWKAHKIPQRHKFWIIAGQYKLGILWELPFIDVGLAIRVIINNGPTWVDLNSYKLFGTLIIMNPGLIWSNDG